MSRAILTELQGSESTRLGLIIFALDAAGIPWGTSGTGHSTQVEVDASRLPEAQGILRAQFGGVPMGIRLMGTFFRVNLPNSRVPEFARLQDMLEAKGATVQVLHTRIPFSEGRNFLALRQLDLLVSSDHAHLFTRELADFLDRRGNYARPAAR